MTGCIGGKRYLRSQVLNQCKECWTGRNVLEGSRRLRHKTDELLTGIQGWQSRESPFFGDENGSLFPTLFVEGKDGSLDAGRHKDCSSTSCWWWKSWRRRDLGRSGRQYKTAVAECRNSCALNESR